MSAVVVMPVAITDEYRFQAFEFVKRRLAEDGWPIVASSHEFDALPTWCKADAVHDALDRAPGRDDDVLIVHDADCVVDLGALRGAVDVIERDEYGWAIPYTHVVRLSQYVTESFMRGGPPSQAERAPYIGIPGGGVVVLRRSTYATCPLDRRFIGWGDEDQSWGWALGTLFGAPWRHDADVVHLWHPPAVPHGQRRSTSMASNKLRRAYSAYRTEPRRMRDLVADAALASRTATLDGRK